MTTSTQNADSTAQEEILHLPTRLGEPHGLVSPSAPGSVQQVHMSARAVEDDSPTLDEALMRDENTQQLEQQSEQQREQQMEQLEQEVEEAGQQLEQQTEQQPGRQEHALHSFDTSTVEASPPSENEDLVADLSGAHDPTGTGSSPPAAPVSAADHRSDQHRLPPFQEFFPAEQLPRSYENVQVPASAHCCQPTFNAGVGAHEQHFGEVRTGGFHAGGMHPAPFQLAPTPAAAGVGRAFMLVPHTALCLIQVQGTPVPRMIEPTVPHW